MDYLYTQLKKYGKARANVLLSKFCTIKIGGPADWFIDVTDNEKLVELLNFLNSEGIDWLILGGGSNLLFPDVGLHQVVIRINTNKVTIKGNIVEVDAGVSFGAMMMASVKSKLSGFEWAMGLPGSVGGAIRGNAAARWGELASGGTEDKITKVEVWRDSEVLTLTPAECGFTYRDSNFKHNNDVILKAWFELEPGDPKISLPIMQEVGRRRREHSPPFPSAGSFFKNVAIDKWQGKQSDLPPTFIARKKIPTGWLVEKVGLRGLTVGGARSSEEHANYIINFNHATQADVLELVEKIKNAVYNRFGIALEEEVQVIK